ncbi:MAG: Epoxyqueuosine reductase [Alphaproteobacteria bacterium MarineAlpha3_Bin5]|nr:MAG: Epoxyqueuosine reductase [Alphaproteobacteria bacterium MarineAlpha3_Bin5]
MDKKLKISAMARALGFDDIGFTSPEVNSFEVAALAKFVKQERHGEMDWLARSDGKRGIPSSLMSDVKTIISLGVNYGPVESPIDDLEHPQHGSISVYARGDDYHKVIKKPLKRLTCWICEEFNASAKFFIDTAPVMEKPIAMRAGLGWQGKHTNLVSRKFGSWLFLAEIYTNLSLRPDNPEVDHCGECDACLRACPTGALDEPYKIDPRKCISYLTIEHKGEIKPDLMDRMGNRIFGCDDCLAVCPWNKFSKPSKVEEFKPRPELEKPSFSMLAKLDDKSFRHIFTNSAIKRTGRDRFIRNVLIAIGNSNCISFYKLAKNFINDRSSLIAEVAARACKLIENSSKASVTKNEQG